VKWQTQATEASSSSKRQPAGSDQFKKDTKEKTQEKDTYKQQAANAAVAVENVEGLRLLIDAGFDKHVATKLAASRGVEEIQQQIGWVDSRNPDSNPLGLLRIAIEQGWSEPANVTNHLKKEKHVEVEQQKAKEDELREAEVAARKREIRHCRDQLRPTWDRLPEKERSQIEQVAFEQLQSDFDRKRFRSNESYRLDLSLDELSRRRTEFSLVTHSS
jgi:hypothetical protein